MKYRHLNQSDRDRIQALLSSGIRQIEIAKVLGVHKGTISREIVRHEQLDGTYRASNAEHKARIKRGNSKYQGMKIERNPALKQFIIAELKKNRSPDEIAGRMRREKRNSRINKDAVYKWLYSSFGERYCKYLCTKRKRKRIQKKTAKREMIPNRISVFERPKRGTHAEGDTFLSPQEIRDAVALVGLKKEKYLIGLKVSNLKPEIMKEAIQKIVSKIKIDTLTFDNGIENRYHEQFGIPSYFCNPHAPWQKPFIENSIGLIRRWFIPKGTDLRGVSQEQLDSYLAILNNKYRKSLGYRSASELVEMRGIMESINSASCT
jgi:IS30 family transposase